MLIPSMKNAAPTAAISILQTADFRAGFLTNCGDECFVRKPE
jgi:hypothetical protein